MVFTSWSLMLEACLTFDGIATVNIHQLPASDNRLCCFRNEISRSLESLGVLVRILPVFIIVR
jgi:hypothetical protein